MIIWDTGEYEILPEKPKHNGRLDTGPETETEENDESESEPEAVRDGLESESEKLRKAFQNVSLSSPGCFQKIEDGANCFAADSTKSVSVSMEPACPGIIQSSSAATKPIYDPRRPQIPSRACP